MSWKHKKQLSHKPIVNSLFFFFFSLFSYAFGMPHFHICFWLFAETSCYRHREGIRTAMLMCQFHWLKCYCDVDKTLLGTPNPIGLRWDRAIIVACFHLNPIIFTFDPKFFFFFPNNSMCYFFSLIFIVDIMVL